ncbi:aerotaxis receptor Aer [Alishewanella longhuensis]
MGLVKNRCKNGDYYWVDAYVTPVTEKGNVIGYESVRSCPKREDVARAEKLYTRINTGKTLAKESKISALNSALIAFVILCAALFISGYQTLSELLLISGVVVYAILASLKSKQVIQELQEILGTVFTPTGR